jgi:hypothetical protein
VATTSEQRLQRIEHDVREVLSLLHKQAIRSIYIMGIVEDIQAQNELLKQKAAEAKADADRHMALTTQVITKVQDQQAAIAALQEQIANGQVATVEQLEAIKASGVEALALFDEANVKRDEADTSLSGAAG